MDLMRDLRRELKSADAFEPKSFGLTLAAVAGLCAALSLWKHRAEPGLPGAAVFFFVAGVALVAAALLRPSLLAAPARWWKLLSLVLGFFMSRLVLLAVYFLLLTPLALVMRTMRKTDPLNRRFGGGESHWIRRESVYSPADTEKPY